MGQQKVAALQEWYNGTFDSIFHCYWCCFVESSQGLYIYLFIISNEVRDWTKQKTTLTLATRFFRYYSLVRPKLFVCHVFVVSCFFLSIIRVFLFIFVLCTGINSNAISMSRCRTIWMWFEVEFCVWVENDIEMKVNNGFDRVDSYSKCCDKLFLSNITKNFKFYDCRVVWNGFETLMMIYFNQIWKGP